MPQVESHDSVTAMAEAYARKAIEEAPQYTAKLDYSENSLMELEIILEQVADNTELWCLLPTNWAKSARPGAATLARSFVAGSEAIGPLRPIRANRLPP